MNKSGSIIDEILEYNYSFVANKTYEEYQASKFPEKKLVILTCMDTRLMDLLPRAMNLKNGDAKVIKNAGALVSHPFCSVMRSILVAVYQLDARDICVVGHHDCGLARLRSETILAKALERGVSEEKLQTLTNAGIDLNRWLTGFDSVEESVINSVNRIKNHPLLPPQGISVHGLIIHPETGKLDVVVQG